MIEGGIGGGNTKTGLNFEKRVDILTLLKSKKGYSVHGNIVFYDGKEVAKSFKKNISKKLLPDEAIYVIVNNTLFIVEIKFQKVSGSVDEKLQTCDFKRK